MTLETFFAKFDLFADAPSAVAKIRELVMQLAVHGRLVPQDSNEETAEQLIARVSATLPEKKSDNPFLGEIDASITDESEYELPNGWAWLPLGHVGIWATGCGFPTQYQGEADKEFLFCKVSDMNLPGNEIEIHTTVHTIDTEVMKKIRARANPAGTVIFPKIGGAIATHKRRLVIKQTIIDNNCSGIQPIGLTEDRWLLLFMRNLDLTKYQSGTSVPAVSQGALDPIRIGLPPLAEQKRIVAKVDELMALCDRLEAQQQEREQRHAALARASRARFADAPTPANINFLFHKSYDIPPADLRKTILTLAVQGKLVPQDPNDEPAEELLARIGSELTPEQRRNQAAPLAPIPAETLQYELPESWKWAHFRDAAIIASHLVKPHDFLDFTHLAPDNIEKGNGVLLPCRTVREDKVISSNHRFSPGQIIYSKIRPNLAKVVVVDFEGLCSADMYPIDALIDPFYLQRYMLSESFLVQAVKTDTRVAMPKINQMELNAITVPIPPLAEQRRIVAKVDALMALVDELEARLAASRAAGEKLLAALVAELTSAPPRGDDEAAAATVRGL